MFKIIIYSPTLLLLFSFRCRCTPLPDLNNPGNNAKDSITGILSDKFQAFLNKHGKNYATPQLAIQAQQNFQANLDVINAHNQKAALGGARFTMAPNQFADKPITELRQTLLTAKVPTKPVTRLSSAPELRRIHKRSITTLPKIVNYTAFGFMYDIENQGNCGSCWAFAAASTLAAHYTMYSLELLPLSAQNLLDCSGTSYNNYGCNGGWPGSAMEYIKDNGVTQNSSYPYIGYQGTCKYASSQSITAPACISGVNYLKDGDEDAIKTALFNVGPIAAGINADSMEFMYYSSGIYTDDSCNSTINHAVVITGYGTAKDGTPYWIVRNSWGDKWGEQGYARFARNGKNQCGICSWAHYPVLSTC